MSSYTANIPQPTDRPSSSQSQLLNNFTALKTFLDRNHVPIIDPTTNTAEGKHRFLQMPVQAAAPATAASEGGLYVKTVGANSSLFYRQQSNGTEIQITGRDPNKAANGSTSLPGGLRLQWGSQAFTGSTNITIAFNSAFTTVYQVVACLYTTTAASADRKFSVSNVTNTNFRAWCENNTPATVGVRWMAVGLQAS